MGVYRFYFLDQNGSIRMRKDFCAANDETAVQIAWLVARIFANTCSGFALWYGKRQILDWRGQLELNGFSRPICASLEDMLARSHWSLGETEKLLALVGRQPAAIERAALSEV